MTVGVRNWPRKPLSDRERTIREALSRFGSSEDRSCTFVPAGGGLQLAINDLGVDGGTLCLEQGTYTGNITIPTTVGNVRIIGAGVDVTFLSGSILIETSNAVIEHLTIRATDQAYGVKIYKSGATTTRNEFKHCYIGGTLTGSPPAPSGNGPTGPGVWLDGALLSVFDHCTIAGNDGDGVYVNTSDATAVYTTNVNMFRDCTVSSNGGYGVKAEVGADGVAGMQQLCFIGGNNESNVSGAAYARSVFYLAFDNVDFETGVNHGSGGWLLDIGSCTEFILRNCAANSTGDTGRLFMCASCGWCRVTNNRVQGKWSRMDIGVFDENCGYCTDDGNQWFAAITTTSDSITPRWVSNRGQMWGWSA